MGGSPIIQNGKAIGAAIHAFVQDASKEKTPCISAACSKRYMGFLNLCGESRTLHGIACVFIFWAKAEGQS